MAVRLCFCVYVCMLTEYIRNFILNMLHSSQRGSVLSLWSHHSLFAEWEEFLVVIY
jgi:hypothetical protein